MNITITSDTNYFNIVFNDLAADRKEASILKSEIRSVCLVNDTKGVEVIFKNGNSFVLDYNKVDSINGDTITSQTILFTKIKALR